MFANFILVCVRIFFAPTIPVDTNRNRKESKELLFRDAVVQMEFENIQCFRYEGKACLSIKWN